MEEVLCGVMGSQAAVWPKVDERLVVVMDDASHGSRDR
jgi:hypothetical protein